MRNESRISLLQSTRQHQARTQDFSDGGGGSNMKINERRGQSWLIICGVIGKEGRIGTAVMSVYSRNFSEKAHL